MWTPIIVNNFLVNPLTFSQTLRVKLDPSEGSELLLPSKFSVRNHLWLQWTHLTSMWTPIIVTDVLVNPPLDLLWPQVVVLNSLVAWFSALDPKTPTRNLRPEPNGIHHPFISQVWMGPGRDVAREAHFPLCFSNFCLEMSLVWPIRKRYSPVKGLSHYHPALQEHSGHSGGFLNQSLLLHSSSFFSLCQVSFGFLPRAPRVPNGNGDRLSLLH